MTDMITTPSKIEMSSARVTFGNVDLGGVTDGITFTYTVTVQKVFVDQLSMPVKHFITQEEAQVVVNLSEYSFANLQKVLPTGTYVLDSQGTKKKIGMGGAQIDTDNDYEELIITPILGGSGTLDTDTNLKITIFKAISVGNVEIGFNKEGVRVIAVTFDAIADTSLTAGQQLFLLGDSEATA